VNEPGANQPGGEQAKGRMSHNSGNYMAFSPLCRFAFWLIHPLAFSPSDFIAPG